MSVPVDPLTPRTLQRPAVTESSAGKRSSLRAYGSALSADLDALKDRVYGPGDSPHYGTRDKLIILAADLTMYPALRAIGSTLRWEVRGREHLDKILADGHLPIFTFWHVCIIGATWFFRNRGIVVMSSVSRDAEYTGRVIKRFGYGTARGSATRGGGRALVEMALCLEHGIEVGFTIDGPRGPAYVAKPGAVTLARHTGQAILPFHIAAGSCIELKSWDRLQIPLPFSRAATFIGEPIYVPRDATSEDVAVKQTELQCALERLRLEADEWRAKGKSGGRSATSNGGQHHS
jgi:lysophospholipid acyltransferase (LPLAT)-like uncharacterized protein